MADKKSGGGSDKSSDKSSSDSPGRPIEKKQPRGPVTGSGNRGGDSKPKPGTGDLGPNKKK